MSEKYSATWQKRFMQKHYSYRDYHTVQTTVLTETQLNALIIQNLEAILLGGNPVPSVYYRFGDNARTDTLMNSLTQLYGSNPAYYLWPRLNDPFGPGNKFPGNCYAREIKVTCNQDAWIRMVSVNPEYLRQATQQALEAITVTTAPPLLIEKEQELPQDEEITFYPTYGYGIFFRADSVAGTLMMWIEGNVEGTE